jgi:hypothetical protein
MTLFTDPRCPQCNAQVPLAGLWARAAKDRGGIFLIGKVGIGCPSCGARLRVLQTGLAIAAVGSFAAFCAAFGILGVTEHAKLGAAKQDLNLLLIAPAIVGWMFMFRRYGYRFARVRAVEEGEKLVLPLSRPVLEQPIAAKRLDQQTKDVGPPSQGATERPRNAGNETTPWICPECGEENPGQFNICCICETHRDASEQR